MTATANPTTQTVLPISIERAIEDCRDGEIVGIYRSGDIYSVYLDDFATGSIICSEWWVETAEEHYEDVDEVYCDGSIIWNTNGDTW
jgi:hypothetical protein|tara:strand:+ start:588 stop:848 length:261 start_codon:yes stop_codon:yes gene_type:complete